MVVKFQFYHLYKCPWDVVTSIHVSKYPTNKEPNVIGAEIIEKTKVSEERDLGVVVDRQLKFCSHAKSVSTSALQSLGMLKRIISSRCPCVFMMLYQALVRPLPKLRMYLASFHFKKDKEVLEIVQRGATKMVEGLKQMPYQERLRRFMLATLKYRKNRGELSYLKYIVTCLNVLPSFLRKVEALNIEAVQYEEECWIYKDRRIMKVKSRNLTLSQFTEMTETSVFRQCSRDPSWTEIEQEGQIVVKGLGPANWLIERFIQKFFERGIKKNVKLMEELIEERYGLQFPKPSS